MAGSAAGVRSTSGSAPGESSTSVVVDGMVACGTGKFVGVGVIRKTGWVTRAVASGVASAAVTTVGETCGVVGLAFTAWQAARLITNTTPSNADIAWKASRIANLVGWIVRVIKDWQRED